MSFSATLLARRARTTLFLGQAPDGVVVYKVPNGDRPSPRDLARLRNELEISRAVRIPGVRRALREEALDGREALVLEYVEGAPIKLEPPATRAAFDRFLRLSTGVARTLGELHRRGIVHRDVKPSNLLLDPAHDTVTIIDFGIATQGGAGSAPGDDQELEGTVEYMSPEQTGRVNRAVDGRSDLYSLGVTFYELLTGRLPFTSTDVSELVHCQVALLPPPPAQQNPAVPEILSAIVMKLLAKDPEERYQSAHGLAHDLERVATRREASGEAPAFPLGERDRAGRLRFPRRLYGRDAELAELLGAFDRAAAGSAQLVLIEGTSGVGKSALARAVEEQVTARSGHLVEGKFDQLQRTIPHSALVQAFRELVGRFLTEREAELADLRRRIGAAVGLLGRVLTALVPNLELILGPQGEAPPLEGADALNRFHYLLRAFVRAVSPAEHPLVLVLDDLQFADEASLDLLRALLTEGTGGHLLIVGTCRDGEIGEGHPLRRTLESLRAGGFAAITIRLAELGNAELEALVVDALDAPLADAAGLAAVIHEKTGGNGFFARQFIESLHDRGLLAFDFEGQRWTWDAPEIRRLAIADNVVDLMTERMHRLRGDALDALELAASLGGRFDLSLLAMLRARSLPQVAAELEPAIEAGLITITAGGAAAPRELAFVHDRIQQAAYSLVPEPERKALHLRTGRLLMEHTPRERRAERLFDIVNHLDVGADLLTGAAEREELCRLNLEAGRRAAASFAFPQALGYLRVAERLTDPGVWTARYDLALSLSSEIAYVASMTGDDVEVERSAGAVLQRAATTLDKRKAYVALVVAPYSRGDMPKTLRVGLAALREFGETFPERPGMPHVFAALARTKIALLGRSIESLASLPPMTDESKIEAMHILERLIPPAFRSGSQLLPLFILRMVDISLARGAMPVTAFAFANYGHIMSGVLGDYDAGYSFGELARRLVERPGFERSVAPVLFVFNNFLLHWKQPLSAAIPSLLDATQSGFRSGLTFEAVWAAFYRALWMYVSGHPLDDLRRHLRESAATFKREDHARHAADALEQHIATLCDGAASGGAAGANDGDPGDKTHQCLHHLLELERSYLFDDHRAAVDHAARADALLPAVLGMPYIPLIHFYGALARMAAHRAHPRPELLAGVRASRRQFRKWARHSPANYQHKHLLLEAEHARTTGNTAEARGLYERAIAAARASGYVQEEGLALELAGGLYADLGQPAIADLLLGQAVAAYRRWGAAAKADLLEARMSRGARRIPLTPEASGRPASTSSAAGTLDLNSMMKASRAIAGEILMDRLLARLVEIVVENAGAQRGALLILEHGELAIEARTSPDDGRVVVGRASSLEQSATVCEAAVRYVARTNERLVLEDAAKIGPFQQDLYVQQHRVRSILCAPIKQQGKLTGVLYLENNAIANAFTPARCEVLDLLSAQTAISLENARLYDTLDQRVKEQTQELRLRNGELSAALERLQETQKQLVLQEKLASLGALTAGIAHEIKNPLNFVNNFAELSVGFMDELEAELDPHRAALGADAEHVAELIRDLRQNMGRINEHGKRADGIVRSMLEHSRGSPGERRDVDVNALLAEYVNLGYQGLRSQRSELQVNIETSYEPELGSIKASPQDLCRVFLNLVNNACYAASTKGARRDGSVATVRVSTRSLGDGVEIRVWDNGAGIQASLRDRIFTPFFTTKPTGEGTGLGLSISHGIVQSLGGSIRFDTEEGVFAEFIVTVPR